MLVLCRKPGEKIVIGDDIVIHILESSHSSNVRIGIDAPLSVPVHREEIYKKIKSEAESIS